mgnify:CR=1 FL=1
MVDKNNICFYMNEIKKENECDIHDTNDDSWIDNMKKKIYQLEDNEIETDLEISKEFLLEMEFNKYTLKEIYLFCDYYKLSKYRKKKNELVKNLIEFEVNPENLDIVETRRILWNYLITLKEDSFFKKFILCDR